MVEKFFRKFYKYVKSRKSTEFQKRLKTKSKPFRIIKSRPTRNHLNQYFEKFFRKIINFYKKFEEQSKNKKKKLS